MVEQKAIRRSRGRGYEVPRIAADVRKLERLSRLSTFRCGYLVVVGLGFSHDQFNDWIDAGDVSRRGAITSAVPLRSGGYAHVGVIIVPRPLVSSRPAPYAPPCKFR